MVFFVWGGGGVDYLENLILRASEWTNEKIGETTNTTKGKGGVKSRRFRANLLF